jgi:hypothetical protein
MSEATKEVIKNIEARKPAYIASAQSAGEKVEFGSELNEMAQMMNGFFSILINHLEQKPSDQRILFMETLMPAAIEKAKNGASDIIYGSMLFGMKFIDDIVNSIDPKLREEAFGLLSQFFAGYIAEIAKVGTQV